MCVQRPPSGAIVAERPAWEALVVEEDVGARLDLWALDCAVQGGLVLFVAIHLVEFVPNVHFAWFGV